MEDKEAGMALSTPVPVGVERCVWTGLGVIKCKQCGFTTSDSALSTAHVCRKKISRTPPQQVMSQSKRDVGRAAAPALSRPVAASHTRLISRASPVRVPEMQPVEKAQTLRNSYAQHDISTESHKVPENELASNLPALDTRRVAERVPVTETLCVTAGSQHLAEHVTATETSGVTASDPLPEQQHPSPAENEGLKRLGYVVFDPQSARYCCQQCTFKGKEREFIEHLLYQVQEKAYNCYYCKDTFQRRDGLNAHLEVAHPGQPKKCKLLKICEAKSIMKEAENNAKICKRTAFPLHMTFKQCIRATKSSIPIAPSKSLSTSNAVSTEGPSDKISTLSDNLLARTGFSSCTPQVTATISVSCEATVITPRIAVPPEAAVSTPSIAEPCETSVGTPSIAVPCEASVSTPSIAEPCEASVSTPSIAVPCEAAVSTPSIAEPCEASVSTPSIAEPCEASVSTPSIAEPCEASVSTPSIAEPCEASVSTPSIAVPCEASVSTPSITEPCEASVSPPSIAESCEALVSTPSIAEPCQASVSTPSIAEPCEASVSPPSIAVRCEASVSTPSISEPCEASVSTSSIAVQCEVSVSTLSIAIPCEALVSTLSIAEPCAAPVSTPSSAVPCEARVSTPTIVVPCEARVSTPSSAVPCEAQVSTPSIVVPREARVSTPSSAVPCEAQVSTPSIVVPREARVSTPSSAVPYEARVSTPSSAVPREVPVSTSSSTFSARIDNPFESVYSDSYSGCAAAHGKDKAMEWNLDASYSLSNLERLLNKQTVSYRRTTFGVADSLASAVSCSVTQSSVSTVTSSHMRYSPMSVNSNSSSPGLPSRYSNVEPCEPQREESVTTRLASFHVPVTSSRVRYSPMSASSNSSSPGLPSHYSNVVPCEPHREESITTMSAPHGGATRTSQPPFSQHSGIHSVFARQIVAAERPMPSVYPSATEQPVNLKRTVSRHNSLNTGSEYTGMPGQDAVHLRRASVSCPVWTPPVQFSASQLTSLMASRGNLVSRNTSTVDYPPNQHQLQARVPETQCFTQTVSPVYSHQTQAGQHASKRNTQYVVGAQQTHNLQGSAPTNKYPMFPQNYPVFPDVQLPNLAAPHISTMSTGTRPHHQPLQFQQTAQHSTPNVTSIYVNHGCGSMQNSSVLLAQLSQLYRPPAVPSPSLQDNHSAQLRLEQQRRYRPGLPSTGSVQLEQQLRSQASAYLYPQNSLYLPQQRPFYGANPSSLLFSPNASSTASPQISQQQFSLQVTQPEASLHLSSLDALCSAIQSTNTSVQLSAMTRYTPPGTVSSITTDSAGISGNTFEVTVSAAAPVSSIQAVVKHEHVAPPVSSPTTCAAAVSSPTSIAAAMLSASSPEASQPADPNRGIFVRFHDLYVCLRCIKKYGKDECRSFYLHVWDHQHAGGARCNSCVHGPDDEEKCLRTEDTVNNVSSCIQRNIVMNLNEEARKRFAHRLDQPPLSMTRNRPDEEQSTALNSPFTQDQSVPVSSAADASSLQENSGYIRELNSETVHLEPGTSPAVANQQVCAADIVSDYLSFRYSSIEDAGQLPSVTQPGGSLDLAEADGAVQRAAGSPESEQAKDKEVSGQSVRPASGLDQPLVPTASDTEVSGQLVQHASDILVPTASDEEVAGQSVQHASDTDQSLIPTASDTEVSGQSVQHASVLDQPLVPTEEGRPQTQFTADRSASPQDSSLKGDSSTATSGPLKDFGRYDCFFICMLCEFSCDSATDFTMHLNADHHVENEFPCYHCHYRGKYCTDLTNHISDHTVGETKVYACSSFVNQIPCDYATDSLRSFAEHLKFGHSSHSYQCSKCGEEFVDGGKLLQHLKQSSMTLYSCSRCPARFLEKAAITAHCRTRHNGSQACRVVKIMLCLARNANGYLPDSPGRCSQRKSSDDLQDLLGHCSRKSSEDVESSALLSSVSNVAVPEAEVHTESDGQNDVVPIAELFGSEELHGLLAGTLYNLEEGKLICCLCEPPKTFNKSKSLHEHLFIHTKNWLFRCILCEEGFLMKKHVTKHFIELHPNLPREIGKRNVRKSFFLSELRKSAPLSRKTFTAICDSLEEDLIQNSSNEAGRSDSPAVQQSDERIVAHETTVACAAHDISEHSPSAVQFVEIGLAETVEGFDDEPVVNETVMDLGDKPILKTVVDLGDEPITNDAKTTSTVKETTAELIEETISVSKEPVVEETILVSQESVVDKPAIVEANISHDTERIESAPMSEGRSLQESDTVSIEKHPTTAEKPAGNHAETTISGAAETSSGCVQITNPVAELLIPDFFSPNKQGVGTDVPKKNTAAYVNLHLQKDSVNLTNEHDNVAIVLTENLLSPKDDVNLTNEQNNGAGENLLPKDNVGSTKEHENAAVLVSSQDKAHSHCSKDLTDSGTETSSPKGKPGQLQPVYACGRPIARRAPQADETATSCGVRSSAKSMHAPTSSTHPRKQNDASLSPVAKTPVRKNIYGTYFLMMKEHSFMRFMCKACGSKVLTPKGCLQHLKICAKVKYTESALEHAKAASNLVKEKRLSSAAAWSGTTEKLPSGNLSIELGPSGSNGAKPAKTVLALELLSPLGRESEVVASESGNSDEIVSLEGKKSTQKKGKRKKMKSSNVAEGQDREVSPEGSKRMKKKRERKRKEIIQSSNVAENQDHEVEKKSVQSPEDGDNFVYRKKQKLPLPFSSDSDVEDNFVYRKKQKLPLPFSSDSDVEDDFVYRKKRKLPLLFSSDSDEEENTKKETNRAVRAKSKEAANDDANRTTSAPSAGTAAVREQSPVVYQCLYCEHSGADEAEMKVHLSSHPLTRQLVRCGHCGQMYGSKDRLARHSQTQHLGQQQILEVPTWKFFIKADGQHVPSTELKNGSVSGTSHRNKAKRTGPRVGLTDRARTSSQQAALTTGPNAGCAKPHQNIPAVLRTEEADIISVDPPQNTEEKCSEDKCSSGIDMPTASEEKAKKRPYPEADNVNTVCASLGESSVAKNLKKISFEGQEQCSAVPEREKATNQPCAALPSGATVNVELDQVNDKVHDQQHEKCASFTAAFLTQDDSVSENRPVANSDLCVENAAEDIIFIEDRGQPAEDPLILNDKENLPSSATAESKMPEYKCTLCGHTFTGADAQINLTVHKARHANFKVYSCHICSLQFITEKNVRDHYEKQHPREHFQPLVEVEEIAATEVDVLPASEREVGQSHGVVLPQSICCQFCEMRLDCVSAFKEHFISCHGNSGLAGTLWLDTTSGATCTVQGMPVVKSAAVIRQYLCAYCSFRTNTRTLMVNHRKETHADKLNWYIQLLPPLATPHVSGSESLPSLNSTPSDRLPTVSACAQRLQSSYTVQLSPPAASISSSVAEVEAKSQAVAGSDLQASGAADGRKLQQRATVLVKDVFNDNSCLRFCQLLNKYGLKSCTLPPSRASLLTSGMKDKNTNWKK